MGLIKTGLIIGGIVLGLGAIGGVTASVISSQKQSSENAISSETKPISNEMINEQPDEENAGDLTAELQKVVTTIKDENIIIHPIKTDDSKADLSMQLQRKDVYAFNVKSVQLSYKQDADLKEKGLNLELSIDPKNNSVSSLNDGNLIVDLTLKKDQDSQFVTRKLTLKNFKQGSSTLKNIVETNQDQQEEKKDYLLTLSPKSENENTFISIEQLNKQEKSAKSGLTTWLEKSTLGLNAVQDVVLSGQVKLEKISKAKSKTEFLLVPENENNPLKLTAKKSGQSEVEELLISGIKTNNLLASSIEVIPIGVDQNETTKLVNSLKELSGDDAYIKDEEKLGIKINEDSSMILIDVSAFSIEKKSTDTVNEIPITLEVSFGNKKYSTKEINDWNELKQASFNFQIFSKKISSTEASVKSTSIKEESNKLATYFKTTNFNTPSVGSEKNDSKEGMDKGEYYVTKLESTSSTADIKLDVKKSSKDNMSNPMQIQNLIVFANYSYKGISKEMNKVLYTPNLSLIQILKTSQAA